MDGTIDGEELAALVGDDLARDLDLAGGEFTPGEVDAVAAAMAESAALAEAVAAGEADRLPELFQPSFVDATTDFADFEAMVEASPWVASDLPAVFAGRGADDPAPAARTSAFLSRTSAFEAPGEMVRAAVVDRTRREIAACTDSSVRRDGAESAGADDGGGDGGSADGGDDGGGNGGGEDDQATSS